MPNIRRRPFVALIAALVAVVLAVTKVWLLTRPDPTLPLDTGHEAEGNSAPGPGVLQQ